MWIVQIALKRPYTFVVVAVLVAILGVAAIVSMPVDIFPYIDIPVVSVVWQYGGLAPEEMEKRMTVSFERSMTTTVNDIEHIESQSYNGVAVIRVYLQPAAKVEMAIAQITAQAQANLRAFPPGTQPPNVIKYDASAVPILQLGLESKTLAEQQLFDYGNNFLRTQLSTVQGISVPLPYGGKFRAVQVDLNPDQMYAKQLTASDVSSALAQQNLIIPAGTAKIGDRDYQIKLNSSPRVLADMNNLPVKVANGATVFLKDVAQVRDGNTVQTSIVRVNGSRGALLTIMRNGKASTLSVVNAVRRELPKILAGLPESFHVRELADQSLFVRASVNGVVREAVMAAFLTGLMILLFLGSWRSTLIVCISIPLSILASLCVLSLLGQTINVMTLGGMALAVGILVDDATVAVENIHRNIAMRKPLVTAVLDGAREIAAPAFVATLSICIVFVPVLLLTGAAKFLFTPLALAVVFAMLASYFFSRTLVCTMAHRMLRAEMGREQDRGFNRAFELVRASYASLLHWVLDHPGPILTAFLVFVGGSILLAGWVGRDFFPTVDSGQMRLHARAPSGTRIETTETIFADIENEIRRVIPLKEIENIIDNIGLPNGGFNLAFGDSPTIGPGDGEILISLKEDRHSTSAEYTNELRKRLRERFPDVVFFFEAANITNQILNFGLPAPLDIQVLGRNTTANYPIAQRLEQRISQIPGAADVHIHQIVDYPEIRLDVDRDKAGQVGLTQRDVAGSLMISLSSTNQIAPAFWLDWNTGVSYNVNVQTPQYRIDSLDALLRTPVGAPAGNITSSAAGNPQLLANLAGVTRGVSPLIVNHYNTQPVYDVYTNVDRRDLGSVGSAVEKIVAEESRTLPRGTSIEVRGQYRTMQTSFYRLGLGMIFAVVLVYLLMAINFQSWLDPFIILMALPGALAGIVWILFMTGTTFSVPSLMGSIMCVGVATANSILVVVFANDQRRAGLDARSAALAAGHTRMRPVIMTAAAMIIGMLPMALGMGEGGEQNAPLGRAVVGGLTLATGTTLFVVPLVYSLLRKAPPADFEQQIEEEQHAFFRDEILLREDLQ
ncbi:MAG: RND transporter [Terriglobia bacterium]|nr:MAG: RND transporter [Terriglobia bacterium]